MNSNISPFFTIKMDIYIKKKTHCRPDHSEKLVSLTLDIRFPSSPMGLSASRMMNRKIYIFPLLEKKGFISIPFATALKLTP